MHKSLNQKPAIHLERIIATFILILLCISPLYYFDKEVIEHCPIPPKSMVSENRIQLASKLKDYDRILVVSNPRLLRPESDMDLPGYRQLASIIYLLGEFTIQDAILVFDPSSLSIHVFLPIMTERQKVFNGATYDLEALSTRYNATFHFNSELAAFLGKNATISCPSNDDLIQKNISPVLQDLDEFGIQIVSDKKLEQIIIESRFQKTNFEIEALAFASLNGANAHSRLANHIKSNGDGESILAARFELYSVSCGARLQAYNPIVGIGKHAAVLHFPTGETRDQGLTPPKKDNFVLVDAGGAWHGYASDITRTYVTSWTRNMRMVYKIVKEAQAKGLSEHYLGNKWSSVVEATMDTLLMGAIKAQLVIGDFEYLKESNVIKAFMPHGVGHPIGLDTHDPIPDSIKTSNGYDYVLDKGHVNTVEPGIYFIPFLLDQHKTNSSSPWHKLINWKLVDELLPLGGVRIEDVVAIDRISGETRILSRINK